MKGTSGGSAGGQSAGGTTAKHAGGAKHAPAPKHASTAKHAPRAKSKAQQAAAKRWQAAGAKARHAHAVAKQQGHPTPAKWSPNEAVACCAAEALAASLRLTGHQVGAHDVLDLYWRTTAGPDAGAGLWATIEAAAEFGLAGVHPLDARPAREMVSGVVLGVDLAERHAVTVDGHGVWTWGAWRPVSCSFLAAADEAWVITWP